MTMSISCSGGERQPKEAQQETQEQQDQQDQQDQQNEPDQQQHQAQATTSSSTPTSDPGSTQAAGHKDLLALLKSIDPHPHHPINPDVHPYTGKPWIPFHALTEDYLKQVTDKSGNTKPLLPMGRVLEKILVGMRDYNTHLLRTGMSKSSVFEFCNSKGEAFDSFFTPTGKEKDKNEDEDEGKDEGRDGNGDEGKHEDGDRDEDQDRDESGDNENELCAETTLKLEDVKSVAFAKRIAEQGSEAMSEVMTGLTWFLRGGGVIPKKDYDKEDVFAVWADSNSALFELAKFKSKIDTPLSNTSADTPARASMVPWGNEACSILRPVSVDFGTTWAGMHLIEFEGEGKNMNIYMQRREFKKKKLDSAGMLDSTAGGAIELGEYPLDGTIKETKEETGISEAMVRKYAKCTGVQSLFMNATTEKISPLYNHLYELKRPHPSHPDYGATEPKVAESNNEVAGFEVLTVDELKTALLTNQVKSTPVPNFIYFLLRHGQIDPSEVPNGDLEELKRRCHRPLNIAGPHAIRKTVQSWVA